MEQHGISLSILHVKVSMGVLIICSSYIKMGLMDCWLIKWVLELRQKLVCLPIWKVRRCMAHFYLWYHSQLSPTASNNIKRLFFLLTSASFCIYITWCKSLMECDMKCFIDCRFVPTMQILLYHSSDGQDGRAKLQRNHMLICPLKKHFYWFSLHMKLSWMIEDFLAKYKWNT